MSNIKQRLKSAYENVEFFANTTWSCYAQSYQKANQELYAREQKVQENLMGQKLYPRTVQECIPQSRLAQLCNFEYNDSREISYASSVSDINFYYPCIYKRGSCVEPWMLPETEQLFIWFAHSQNLGTIDSSMFELNHLDEPTKSLEQIEDFHKINAIMHENIEKTPGEFRYTSAKPLSEDDLTKYKPALFKVDTFDEMILKMQISLEKVKKIWQEDETSSKNVNPESSSEKRLNIFKSPLGNFIVFDNSSQFKDKPEKSNLDQHEASDLMELKMLADAIKPLQLMMEEKGSLEENLVPTLNVNMEEMVSPTKPINLPARRLYSAVVQGLYCDSHAQNRVELIPLAAHNIAKHKETPVAYSENTGRSIFPIDVPLVDPDATSTYTINRKTSPISQPPPLNYWLAQEEIQTHDQGKLDITNESINRSIDDNSNSSINSSRSNFTKISLKERQKTDTASFKINNNNNSDWNYSFNDFKDNFINENQYNVPFSSTSKSVNQSCSSACNFFGTDSLSTTVNPNNSRSVGATAAYNDCSYANVSSASQYNCSSNLCNNVPSNTLFGYSLADTNLYGAANQNTTNLTRNAFPQFLRQNYCVSQQPQSTWITQRLPHICNVPQYQNQPYIFMNPSAIRSNTRWNQNQQFIRSSLSQPYHHVLLNSPQTTAPHWSTQMCGICRGHSIHKPSSPPMQYYENTATFQNNNRIKLKQKKYFPSNFPESPRSSSLSWTYPSTSENNDKEKRNVWEYKRHGSNSGNVGPTTESEKNPFIKTAVSSSVLERSLKVEKIEDELQKSASTLAIAASNLNLKQEEVLPVRKSVSEELEKLALEQYQRSSLNLIKSTDSFYQDMERQAKEQYEGAPENSMSPPNYNTFIFGGLTPHFHLEHHHHHDFEYHTLLPV